MLSNISISDDPDLPESEETKNKFSDLLPDAEAADLDSADSVEEPGAENGKKKADQ
jgi:hypothetical protein